MSQKNKNWINPIIHDRQVVGKIFDWMKENELHKNKFKKPEDLTILTCRNKGEMHRATLIPSLSEYTELSILESNLKYLGIDLVVLTEEYEGPWRCTYKLKWINDYLQSGKCDTEYFMFCDAVDVIFQDDPQRVIDIFKTFDCDMLCMSTDGLDGYDCMPDVKEFIDKTNNNSGRYLNSGIYIGRTNFIKEFMEETMKYVSPDDVTFEQYYKEYLPSKPADYPHKAQDQDIFRFLEPKFYPRLKVDYENLMAYRTWSGVPSGHGLVLNTGEHQVVE